MLKDLARLKHVGGVSRIGAQSQLDLEAQQKLTIFIYFPSEVGTYSLIVDRQLVTYSCIVIFAHKGSHLPQTRAHLCETNTTAWSLWNLVQVAVRRKWPL